MIIYIFFNLQTSDEIINKSLKPGNANSFNETKLFREYFRFKIIRNYTAIYFITYKLKKNNNWEM